VRVTLLEKRHHHPAGVIKNRLLIQIRIMKGESHQRKKGRKRRRKIWSKGFFIVA
jgi:hypothetical protein